jgi:hypothetical protein
MATFQISYAVSRLDSAGKPVYRGTLPNYRPPPFGKFSVRLLPLNVVTARPPWSFSAQAGARFQAVGSCCFVTTRVPGIGDLRMTSLSDCALGVSVTSYQRGPFPRQFFRSPPIHRNSGP